jgi:catechol 2,3-dioxygenase
MPAPSPDETAPPPAPPLRVRELGHVSLFVRDLDASRRFYREVLGLSETGTAKDGRLVFFSAGRHHHDVSLERARVAAPAPPPKGAPGLYHIAFEVGTTLEELAAARRWVAQHGLAPFGEQDNAFCVRDPDGHEIELYVDLRGSGRTRQMAASPAAIAPTAKANAPR